MHKIRESFKGQRPITISPEILLNSQDNLLTKSLYVKRLDITRNLSFITSKRSMELNIICSFIARMEKVFVWMLISLCSLPTLSAAITTGPYSNT